MTAHGYARVSTADQNLDRQTDALAPLVDRLWRDRQSGKDMDRPRWRAMVSALRPGDVLYVASIDRMGRDYGDVCDAWASITALGVDIVVLDMPLLDTRESPGGGASQAGSYPTSSYGCSPTWPSWSGRRSASVRPRASPRPRRGAATSAGPASSGPRAGRRSVAPWTPGASPAGGPRPTSGCARRRLTAGGRTRGRSRGDGRR